MPRPLLLALVWGALPAAAAALVILTVLGPRCSPWALLVVAAPLVEEPLKLVGAAWARWRPATLLDGTWAGAAAGVGFGLSESAMRWFLSQEFVLLTVAVHALASGLAGTAWSAGRRGRGWLAASCAAASLLAHAGWNASVLAG